MMILKIAFNNPKFKRKINLKVILKLMTKKRKKMKIHSLSKEWKQKAGVYQKKKNWEIALKILKMKVIKWIF